MCGRDVAGEAGDGIELEPDFGTVKVSAQQEHSMHISVAV